MAFALDPLAQLNTADPAGEFTGRLDLTRVGIFGHSFGGAHLLCKPPASGRSSNVLFSSADSSVPSHPEAAFCCEYLASAFFRIASSSLTNRSIC